MSAAVKQILLVEDEPTGREILAEVLRGQGYGVDVASGAGAAKLCLESHGYALVIADWLLPDGSGVDVADTAAGLGAKTLIVSGLLFQLPGAARLRHELILKSLGPAAVVEAVRRAIGLETRQDAQKGKSKALIQSPSANIKVSAHKMPRSTAVKLASFFGVMEMLKPHSPLFRWMASRIRE